MINADAMQCVAELRVLTARPSAADEALVPHRLYGTGNAAATGHAASWRRDALLAIAAAGAEARLPILCGGTGMYLAALTGGLASIPAIGVPARARARAELAALGPAVLHPPPQRRCGQATASGSPAPTRSGSRPDAGCSTGTAPPPCRPLPAGSR